MVLSRENKSAYRRVVFLLRRACNLRLKDVSLMAGISEGRISMDLSCGEGCGLK